MSHKPDVHIITSYYPPESGAASNRIYSLSRKLKNAHHNVEVTTPLPNYPDGEIRKGFRGKFKHISTEDGIRINRLWIYASNSTNKFVRLLSMISYGVSLFLYLLFHKTPQITIIQCSPLLTGFFAVLISRLQKKTIIVNVSDLWPLAGVEMGLLDKHSRYYKVLLWIERYIYHHATGIMGQSQEILDHVQLTSSENKNLFLYRNYPEFSSPDIPESSTAHKVKLVYAGLLGVAQGISQLCRKLKLPRGVTLDLYGGGPETDEICKVISDKPEISYHGSLDRAELHNTLVSYDATVVPLKNRIYGSVPSKIFEYARLGIPILFFSAGEGADIVENSGIGYAVRGIDYDKLNRLIKDIVNGVKPLPSKENVRQIAEKEFTLESQFSEFSKWLETFSAKR